jgi:hypothetical protein
VDTGLLHPALFEARVVKSEKELRALRFANQAPARPIGRPRRSVRPRRRRGVLASERCGARADLLEGSRCIDGLRKASYQMRGGGAQVSSRAHISVMQKVRPGQMEYQMEADFLHYCYYHGPRPSRSGPSRSGASSARRTGSPGCRG